MLEILEHGAIAFMYRPRVQTEVARGIEDVQAFYVVLVPAGGRVSRRVRVGRKRLPDGRRRERFWAYVERVAHSPADLVRDLAAAEYWTKTRGLRHQPGPRLAGEGAYALARHGEHVHLAYATRERGRCAEVRDDLRISKEASYIVAAFAASVEREPRATDEDRRFVPLEPEHLDVAGAEMVLIATRETVAADVGARPDPDAEGEAIAALRHIVREASGRPGSTPLLDGVWH
jgi:hypothetical protein